MRAIIVDDEPLILDVFENMLLEMDAITVVGKYTDPFEAIDQAVLKEADIAFLDIEMPDLNGMDVASILKRLDPDINIVFVTAHSDYAVRAFELDAIDYLTRPVQKHRLEETLKRINARSSVQEQVTTGKMVCCFSSLSFLTENSKEPLNPRWRTKRTQEIFAYLLFNTNEKVRKDLLVDMFWPESNWNQGIAQLYSTIYQIRKTLKDVNFEIEIESKENYYLLKLNNIKVDFHEWEKAIDTLGPINQDTIYEHIATIKLYTGNFLETHNYSWAANEQKRLRSTWIYHVRKVTDYLYEQEEFIQAINLCHYAQRIHKTGESIYFQLMKLYAETNNYSAVELQYNTLVKMLKENFDTAPKEEIQKWYADFKAHI